MCTKCVGKKPMLSVNMMCTCIIVFVCPSMTGARSSPRFVWMMKDYCSVEHQSTHNKKKVGLGDEGYYSVY